MKLIADGGSTKADWLLTHRGKSVRRFSTEGINPLLRTEDEVKAMLAAMANTEGMRETVEEVEFYGAGCIAKGREVMTRCLRVVFPKATRVVADSDIIGAARATLGSRKGIACILGTGANSCLWDGSGVTRQTPALGYILGDEGSGAVLGKMLLNAIYKGMLPQSLKAQFESEYGVDMYGVIERVYRGEAPNRWLASLAPFVAEHIGVKEIETLVLDNFEAFISRNILPYRQPAVPLSFVGSIAYYFRPQLRQVAEAHGLRIGTVVRSPLDTLQDTLCQAH